jgi:four helix bundle protein
VGAKRVEDLIVWQLADELRFRIHSLTGSGPAAGDWKFRDQLRDAASSSTRNIAEGFGRFRHREFAQFLRYARGSLFEVSDALRDGIAREYWTAASIKDDLILCKRTTKAVSRFIEYLRTNPDW